MQTFHPAVAAWFSKTFAAPTECQLQAWPAIQQEAHTLIAAPTGSGKTLAAFLCAIDSLVRRGVRYGDLQDETSVLYVSPLKALSNDIQKNLEAPIAGVRDELVNLGLPDLDIRAWVRTGDTSQAERERMRRRPPHIIVTTPESLCILLTSDSGRNMLSTVSTIIVDEIHALANNKRGSHLSLSLERLQALTNKSSVRIGLSATQKPIEQVARFLIGMGRDECTVVDSGHVRERDLAVEIPSSELEAVMAGEVWTEVYDRLAELTHTHTTTLIFVNTRRLAERVARHLAERVGEQWVTAHHGSLSREHRLCAEQRLKAGQLKALVATASLELGIDIGDVDLVCQLGSPRAIGALLQRVGRSGHAVGALPKGRLFPLSRDDLMECAALLHAVSYGELDRLRIPHQPLDVLAQQIVAEVACREWGEDDLYNAFTKSWPYRDLAREHFNDVTRMLAQGFSTRRGRRSAYLHHDAVNKRLRGRRGAKLTAITNAGAIPDQFDYDVVLEPDGVVIGNLNEDFAFESLPGDIFQLGNTSYRILRVEKGTVRVEDAKGQPPNIPFWFGEAPGRTDELSFAVSRLRQEISDKLEVGREATIEWLTKEVGLTAAAATQLTDYLATAKAALKMIPTQNQVVFERFFDEAGDTHLVIHAPFGSRLNRAWGLALRKRFCRKFNFELQAAALEDSIVLSLGPSHSFELKEVANYLKSSSVREVLVQALLAAPMFPTHWRWSCNIALAVKRNRNGKRMPAQLQRIDAEDLIAVVFPDQLACAENLAGQREIPDHPLVNQTISDCLHEVMDVVGLEQLLTRIESGEVGIVCRDLSTPSPLAREILGARPYAFLDDAPAEERRTLAVQARQFLDPESAADMGHLDPTAIERVRQELQVDARTPDELHDALVIYGCLTEKEGKAVPQVSTDTDGALNFGCEHLFESLAGEGRVTRLQTSPTRTLWVAAERLRELQMVFPQAKMTPVIEPVSSTAGHPADGAQALREIIRSRLELLGPVSVAELVESLGVSRADIDVALMALQAEGFVMQGQFCGDGKPTQWCERRLLARIHRYTVKQLRQEIEPVSSGDFVRYLCEWHGVTPDEVGEGLDSLAMVVEQLEGFEAAAVAWESDILPARVAGYVPSLLDRLCLSGRTNWVRLTCPKSMGEKGRGVGPVRTTPIALISRRRMSLWNQLVTRPDPEAMRLSSEANRVYAVLRSQGASFFEDLVETSGLLRTQVEQSLAELVACGRVTSDSFNGLRALLVPQQRRASSARRQRRRAIAYRFDDAGRWSLIRGLQSDATDSAGVDSAAVEEVAWILLRRYGVVFRKLLERELDSLPPWRDLSRTYRRLEARGEIRGGRFVAGFAGEQFALSDAVALLRKVRRRAKDGRLISISAADPLNLVGIVIPGARVPALASNRVLMRDGRVVATRIGGNIEFKETLGAGAEWDARNVLLRQNVPLPYRDGASFDM